MAVGGYQEGPIHPVAGLRLSASAAGIRYRDRADLALIELAAGGEVALVQTRNAFAAAPVVVAREHLARGAPRYLLINSGNANCGLGDDGLADARACCARLAELTDCRPNEVLPFSTGVIGERLPVETLCRALPECLARLEASHWGEAAEAILTSDTHRKVVSRQLDWNGEPVTITGMAKGAGMIRPDMATMLAYIATDAALPREVLEAALSHAVSRSFNRITVDGDTSTNDACALIATAQHPQAAIGSVDEPGFEAFQSTLTELCQTLAEALVGDAEGATKLIELQVTGGLTETECRTVAYTVAHSPLVKTACFAEDPNWGRILAAVGRAGVAELAIGAVAISLNGVPVVAGGRVHPDYTEAQGAEAMRAERLRIHIELGRGDADACVLTTDLSYDYVKINAEYRS